MKQLKQQKNQKNEDRNQKLNELVHGLFNGVTEDDVMRLKDGKYILRGREITQEEVIQIRQDADIFKDSLIWNILRRELQLAANERMFDKSETIEDVVFGKAMLYNLDLIDKKLKNLSTLGKV